MEAVIEYIKKTYAPLSAIVYGSYADGSNNAGSDFDALVICAEHDIYHDTSVVDGIALDVFVYPASYFENEFDPDETVQIADGMLLIDTDARGEELLRRVREHINNIPAKPDEEIRSAVAWCAKMAARADRGDAEGMFRWHWLLADSLEIFCDAVKRRYLGPKKTLKWMEKDFPEAFELYTKALFDLSPQSRNGWIQYLESLLTDL